MKDVAFNIRKLRELRGYSQEYMALKLNLSTKAYSNIENGKTKLKLCKLNEICLLLGVQLSQLVDFSVEAVLASKPAEENLLMEVARLKEHLQFLSSEIVFLKRRNSME